MITGTGYVPGPSLYNEEDFSILDTIHPMACVCWDRDGISDVLAKIEPDGNQLTDRPYPRLWRESVMLDSDAALISLYYGRYSYPLAQFKAKPEPHWELLSADIANAVAGKIGRG